MAKHSCRAAWNTANAHLANKPFDNLFVSQCQRYVPEVVGACPHCQVAFRLSISANNVPRQVTCPECGCVFVVQV